jgi:hypothetical protein
MSLAEDSGKAMAQSLGIGLFSIAEAMEGQADFSCCRAIAVEMLAGAIAAAQ